MQAILSNCRGTKVSGIPEQAIGGVLVRLGVAAAQVGTMPFRAGVAAASIYQQLEEVLDQLGRLHKVQHAQRC